MAAVHIWEVVVMKMPVLLSGHSMTPVSVLRPQSMQLSMRTDGLSSGTMILDEDNPDVTIGSWIQIWAPNGEMCVMYAKNVRKDYITGLKTVTLEHTFGLLAGMVVFGEVDAATMSGTQGATTCSVTDAIDYLLGEQTETLWTRYQVDFNDSQGWKFTNSDIYNDLNSLTDAIMDCQWEFDQSVFPWRLSLKAWPVTATMEMRRSRNLESLKITQDRSGMYTRVYPTGKNNLHISGNYIDRNTGTYGVIANVITDSSIASEGLLRAWATKQLKKNAEPKYTVSITGYELSQDTGESLDKLITGRLCRIPLPEYSTTVTERLTELSWKDCISQPDAVTCTLANELKTITGVLNEKARGGGGGSRKANTEHDCELKEGEERMDEFENSDIWINRDSVWAVCGCYTVTTWMDEHGVVHKKLKVNDGTAMVLERNQAEFGIYDEGNLTGGICVQKINGQSGTVLKLTASVIDIDGIITSLEAKDVMVRNFNAYSGEFTHYLSVLGDINSSGTVSANILDTYALCVNSAYASWYATEVVTEVTRPSLSLSTTHTFEDINGAHVTGKIVSSWSNGSVTTKTLHYLGSAPT